jgi:hypothetical protein
MEKNENLFIKFLQQCTQLLFFKQEILIHFKEKYLSISIE